MKIFINETAELKELSKGLSANADRPLLRQSDQLWPPLKVV